MTLPSSPPDPQKIVTPGAQREVEQLLHAGLWTPREAQAAHSGECGDPRPAVYRAPLLIFLANTTPPPRCPGASERSRRAWRGGDPSRLEESLRRAEARGQTPHKGALCPA
ncbi:hypothetical protein Dgeo_2962 (plasmid) [Deinococcus geothermalis DSM 11300]|uniref:Uncharacterized protein n=1 Tax=Deinococcus geothermalis (strain DSM 11300 / CIP 105573 / AG-3a) TaxID=319795 RepID=A8ZR96_DEIGD|nr:MULTISPECIES: hypothetical protein [Deinococcus]ABW35005.1 hypothetical protein Dgeo_2962 [Deinococcus geothermalis DSM 11300]TDE84995.1 hypothetical protein E0686_14230 [Deinococcus sp. S9]